MKQPIFPAIILFAAVAAEVNKTKAGKLSQIDPRNIFVPEHGKGMHHRSANNYGDMTELVASVKVNGVLNPITVRKVKPTEENGNREYELVFGFRRLAATLQNIQDKVEIPYVNAIVTDATEEETLLQLFAQDTTQVQLNVVEQAEVVATLIARGYEAKELPEKIGKSLAYVYNLIKINTLPKKVKALVSTGKISTNAVLAIMRKESDTDKIANHITEAITNAQTVSNNGNEKRATAANVTVTSPNDRKSPFDKLKAAYRILTNEGVKNDKMALLEVLLTKSTSASVDELAEIIRGAKAPKAKRATVTKEVPAAEPATQEANVPAATTKKAKTTKSKSKAVGKGLTAKNKAAATVKKNGK